MLVLPEAQTVVGMEAVLERGGRVERMVREVEKVVLEEVEVEEVVMVEVAKVLCLERMVVMKVVMAGPVGMGAELEVVRAKEVVVIWEVRMEVE